ncbi:MAG: tetratricopeptide repeat protein [Candidatus Methylomirabilales bacterium]
MRRLLLGLSLIMLACPAPGWGAFQLSPETTQQILRGIDHVANLDYAEARNALRHLKGLPGGDLLYPFLDGIIEMDEAFQEEREEEEAEEILDGFLGRMEPVLAQGGTLLEATPGNPDLLLTLGIMHGVKAAVDRVRKNYFAAYHGIRESHHLLTRTLKVDPHRVDALWMLGLYDYAISRVPALLKPVVAVVLPSGEGRDQGLERLGRVAREGTVAQVPAMVALVRILSGWEQQFDDALPYAEILATRYPGNPEFLFLLSFLYSETQHTSKALAVAEAIRKAVEENRPHFPRELTPRYLQLRGKIAMDAGEYAQALTFFQQAIETQNAKYAWITAWAHTRSGMIYDLLKEREKAVEAYERALEIEGGGLAQQTAERYLSEPYRGKVREPRG